jgi:glycosyltransferase involved in cell wall biosynthesis
VFTAGQLPFNIYPVRILHISSARDYGGGEKHLVDLCRGLWARGHEIFVALRPTNKWESRLDFLPVENILHVSLRNSFGVLSAQRIAEFVTENRIEIIHAHVARDYIPASLACRMSKTTKFVLTRHVLFPLKPFNRFALSNLAKAVAVSSAVEANLQKIFPPQKVALVPNGIEIERWASADGGKLRELFRSSHGISPEAIVIGTIGELIELKGQRDFVLAAREIAAKFPAAHFIVVGKDNSYKKEFRRELIRLVKIFDLENRFLFLDWVEDTAEFFHAADVYVSASHSESFGLAILEAMASGAAIVAAETEGARELLSDGYSARIVPVKDAFRLSEAVGDILADGDMRKKLGENARKTAREKFGLQRMIDETEKIYREIL